jgi:hypothetical protein
VTREQVITLFLWLGAGLEAVGLAVVAAELFSAWRRSRELARATYEMVAEPGHMRVVGKGVTFAYETAGHEPTLKERVAMLETRVAAIDQNVSETKTQLEQRIERVEDEANRLATEAQQEALDAAREVRRLLAEEVGANLWMRWLGAALFVAGLVLSTLANVWSI